MRCNISQLNDHDLLLTCARVKNQGKIHNPERTTFYCSTKARDGRVCCRGTDITLTPDHEGLCLPAKCQKVENIHSGDR